MARVLWTARIANQFRALWKWVLSYRKRDWEISDYPVFFRVQEPDPESVYDSARFKLHRHVARIVNWEITRFGDTREEALQDLSSTFEAIKTKRIEAGRPLPRPGTRVPIELASQHRINAQAELAEDFTQRVLDLDSAWISDESSLWDFHADENNDSSYAKIKEIYGVDVSGIQSGNLAEILERIAAARKPA